MEFAQVPSATWRIQAIQVRLPKTYFPKARLGMVCGCYKMELLQCTDRDFDSLNHADLVGASSLQPFEGGCVTD
jgi:hypothetical protein